MGNAFEGKVTPLKFLGDSRKLVAALTTNIPPSKDGKDDDFIQRLNTTGYFTPSA